MTIDSSNQKIHNRKMYKIAQLSKKLLFCTLICCSVTGHSESVHALTKLGCYRPYPVLLKEAEAIFEGELVSFGTSVQPDAYDGFGEFRVTKQWRGELPETVRVVFSTGGRKPSTFFKQLKNGHRYLLYIKKHEIQANRLVMVHYECSDLVPVSSDEDYQNLHFLREVSNFFSNDGESQDGH